MSARTSPRSRALLDHPRERRRRRCRSRRSASRPRGCARSRGSGRARGRGRRATSRGRPRRTAGAARRSCSSDCSMRSVSQHELLPARAEDRLEHLFLRAEVVVEQAVRDTGLFGDVADARAVEAVTRKDANRRREQLPAPVRPLARTRRQHNRRGARMPPLDGRPARRAADLARLATLPRPRSRGTPRAFSRLGAAVVTGRTVEPPPRA